ncbi:MAG: sensor histidine kinase, partial [Gemmatimonadota bacterium]
PQVRRIGHACRVAFGRARSYVDARRRAERYAIRAAQLEQLRDGLEDHARRIERALAVRNRFLASVSHELRTPINAIVGYNQLLTQGVFGPLSPRHAEVIEKISASADQLLMLVKDVLDLSKIEAGKFAVERATVDVGRLVADVADALEGQARAKGLELRIECPPTLPLLETDTVRVRQILLNLLSNAVKFTERGSVTVRARHIDPETTEPPDSPPGSDGWLAIDVEDTGIGIPREQIDAVFDEFVQVPSETARDGGGGAADGGSGLGLAISRRLAHLLGGDIDVESTLGERSVFTLHLPCPATRRADDATGDPDAVHE